MIVIVPVYSAKGLMHRFSFPQLVFLQTRINIPPAKTCCVCLAVQCVRCCGETVWNCNLKVFRNILENINFQNFWENSEKYPLQKNTRTTVVTLNAGRFISVDFYLITSRCSAACLLLKRDLTNSIQMKLLTFFCLFCSLADIGLFCLICDTWWSNQ